MQIFSETGFADLQSCRLNKLWSHSVCPSVLHNHRVNCSASVNIIIIGVLRLRVYCTAVQYKDADTARVGVHDCWHTPIEKQRE